MAGRTSELLTFIARLTLAVATMLKALHAMYANIKSVRTNFFGFYTFVFNKE